MTNKSKLILLTEFNYHKRRLPHYEDPGGFYFVTFTTVDDLFLQDNLKTIVLDSICFYNGTRYQLHACVIMDAHVHIIFNALEKSKGIYFSLAQIMHGIKSYSAHKINTLLKRKGSVWLSENYDRIIRNDEDYVEKMNYVIYNPVKANIVDKPESYQWLFIKDLSG